VVAGLLVFGVGIFLIGSHHMLFHRTYSLNANFKNVAGLGTGSDVRVEGIREGTVKRVDLPKEPGQEVRVEMALDRATQDVIRKDSTAMIRTEGLMGDEYIEISPGSKDAPKVKDGETLPGASPIEISDLIKKANGILDSAGGALQSVDATAGNLKSITKKVDQGEGTIGSLLNDKKVYQNVEQSTEEMKEDLEAAKHNFLLSHFFHKRGYEDASELTKHEIAGLPEDTAASKVFSYDANKIFDKPDNAKLKQGKPLNQAGAYLQSTPFGLVVTAASMEKGDTDKDRVLTEARATAVRNYLVAHYKLDDKKIRTIGLGKSNELPEGTGVAILVYPSGTSAAKSTAAKQ